MPTLENVSSLAPATAGLQQAIDEAAAAGGGPRNVVISTCDRIRLDVQGDDERQG
ncbi:hypothetical protein [Ruania zhangjianzhongii]|uniref:hypothetical protein n=1 Tax=Ruania zhangjianzhongii TaxID=2603206 RepID=UPI00143DEB58|nr:hypothetical protein [Ruania zhangjianzhongii]